jgi:hypothetical protein
MMEFDLEYVAEGEGKGWWCHADPQGVGAIARGDTPWLAIRAALEDFPKRREENALLEKFLNDLLAGKVACSSCGKPIQMDPETNMCSITHCNACIVKVEMPK